MALNLILYLILVVYLCKAPRGIQAPHIIIIIIIIIIIMCVLSSVHTAGFELVHAQMHGRLLLCM